MRVPLACVFGAFMLLGAGSAAAQECPSCWGVSVGPDGDTQARSPDTYVVAFTVVNTGSLSDTYTFDCSSSGGMSCVSVSPSSWTISPAGEKDVQVTYTVGATGGTVTLTATGNASDQGWYDITVVAGPTLTVVAPIETSSGRAIVRNRQPLLRATFLPSGSTMDSLQTKVTWRGEVVTSLVRHNRGLLEWEVDSTRWLAVGDSGLLTVRVCQANQNCTTANRWVVLPNDSKPVLGFTGMPLEALGRQFAAPFGPGLSVSGAEVETGVGMPSYVSMGAGRSAGLVYSTRQSYPRALVPVDLEVTWPAGTPDQIKLILFDGVAKLDSLVLASPTCATGATRRCRAVLQGDFSASSFATPTRKWLTVEARITSGGTTHIASDSVEAVIVDRRSTMYGSGWWPSGVVKLVAAGSDRLLIGPTGAAAIYRGFGDSLYLSPPGDFSTLVKTASGWEIRPRGSAAKLVFDANGRLIKGLDANGNRDSIAYNGSSDQVTAFVDPVNKAITLGYDGNGKISTFTDPGSRQSRVTVDAGTNQLTYDSISSPTARPYTARFVYQPYSGTHTVVLTKRIGVIADTTIVTYDSTFKRRPTQVRLPGVVDETGAAVNPVIAYTAVERQGFGALRSLDSVYVEVKDPRNHWTRSLVNRWGQARKTWDAIALISRTEYTAEGFVRWVEGKVADSSRVYTNYDPQGHVVSTHILRSPTDRLRLDSLVYDGNHRVIQSIDPRGKVSRISYDALGNVIHTVTPNNDTTRFWYRSDGLVDSTRAPGNSNSRRFTYDATWKNLSQVTDESGLVVAKHYVDGFGRDTASERKVRVQTSGTGSSWQWRRTRAFPTVANQTDSVRIMRTDNCADPCGSPPSWPSASDTVRTQRVVRRFDRPGRDSVRVNDRGKEVRYLYDRLGRLVSRRPWTDSTAVKDSFVYDIAGNLKKTITRRGDTITVNYDSRNRDTLTVIPGVGTLRRAFGGPLDQVTRVWYDSPVDSIGGVNGELRWGYDQRGRLKADTSFTGATARATSYTYDTFERPVTTTDALGAWTVRYETNRGYADTLLTPMGDTITYTFDAQSRAVGPSLRGGGPLQTRVPTWNQTGALSTLSHNVGGASPYLAGKWTRTSHTDEWGTPLTGLWTAQKSSGGAVDTLQDSVTYDGWERVTRWIERGSGGVKVWQDSLVFDRMGNIHSWSGVTVLVAGHEIYDAGTDRLVAKGGIGYTYDRAGNLVASSDGWSYNYDALNRLTSVRKSGTLIARYAYDVQGRRIAKRVYSSSTGGTVAYTRFVYRGAHVAFETDSVGTMGLRYTWGLGVDDLIAIRDASGNHYYVVQDKLRSVRGLVKRDGTWMRSLSYAPHGAVVLDTASASAPAWELRYRWTGREYDAETGWYFFRARYYDPAVRRFVQEDPIGYAGGANLYAYGAGNPLDGRDPSGLSKSIEEIMEALMFNWSAYRGGGGSYDDWSSGGQGGPIDPRYLPQFLETTVNIELLQALVDPVSYDNYATAAQERASQIGGVDIMNRDEYQRMVRAVFRNRRVNLAGALLVGILLEEGRYLVDRWGNAGTSCCGDKTVPGATDPASLVSFINPGVFNHPQDGFVANVFIHEALHHIAAMAGDACSPAVHRTVYRYANQLSSWSMTIPSSVGGCVPLSPRP